MYILGGAVGDAIIGPLCCRAVRSMCFSDLTADACGVSDKFQETQQLDLFVPVSFNPIVIHSTFMLSAYFSRR